MLSRVLGLDWCWLMCVAVFQLLELFVGLLCLVFALLWFSTIPVFIV